MVQRRKGKVGLSAVAELAGVGVATVDRVLNERGGVAPMTARRVIKAARELELKRILPPLYARQLRFEVLLAKPDTLFLARLNDGIVRIAATLDRSVVIQRTRLTSGTPAQVAGRLLASSADGIMFYGESHPVIAAAVAQATAAGRPVVSIVTDLPGSGRLAFVGIDNLKAGRAAGFLAARLARRPGPALVLTNRLTYSAHAARVEGFHAGLARTVLHGAAVLETDDDPDKAQRLLRAALREHPDAVAVYNTGGTVGAAGELLRRQRRADEIVYIAHELTAESRGLLQEGVLTFVIDQAFELQARHALERLLHHFSRPEQAAPPDDWIEVPFTLHTRENA